MRLSIEKKGVLLVGLLSLAIIVAGCQNIRVTQPVSIPDGSYNSNDILNYLNILFNYNMNGSVIANIYSESNKVQNVEFRNVLSSDLDSFGAETKYYLSIDHFYSAINAISIRINYNSTLDERTKKFLFLEIKKKLENKWYVSEVLEVQQFQAQ